MKAKKYIIVNDYLYKRVDCFTGKICPFCEGSNLTTKPEDETFLARTGCLDCDIWLEPVMLKEK